MKSKPAKFSDDQVEFLSLMSLFESPTPMDILRTLRPLPPSEYFDLLEKVEQLSIIKEEKSGAYSLKKNLPVNLKQRIERFHTTENISHLLEQIESMNLSNQLPPSAYFNLLSRSGKDPEAVQVMIHRATDVLANDDPDIAHKYLKGVLSKLSNHLDGARNREMFIDAAISFSKLCTVLGKDFVVAAKFMEQVILSSEILGNKRA